MRKKQYPVVCLECLPEDSRSSFSSDVGPQSHCDFCGSAAPGVPVQRVAERLGSVIQQVFEKGRMSDPVGQLGDTLLEVVGDSLRYPDPELVDALADALIEGDADKEDPFFLSGERYDFRDDADEPAQQRVLWAWYESRVKFRARFFDDEIRLYLGTLVEWMEKVAGPGASHRRVLSPGRKILRARATDSRDDVTSILMDPIRQLRPPPDRRRSAGRLNAAGIAVFYGAFSLDTVSAEIRPAVGSYIVYGEFEVFRDLRVLDLSVFVHPVQHISILAPNYQEHLRWRRFFAELQHVISRPTLDKDAPIDYLPTQILAEYLADVEKFDGIVFRSAQIGVPVDPGQENNVALFHGDFVVEPPEDDLQAKALFGQMGETPAVRYVEGSATPLYVNGARVTTRPLHDFCGELATAEQILPGLFE